MAKKGKTVEYHEPPPPSTSTPPHDVPKITKKEIAHREITVGGVRVLVTVNQVTDDAGHDRGKQAEATYLGPAPGSPENGNGNAKLSGPFDPHNWSGLIDPHNPPEVGQVAGIQWYTSKDELIWSTKGLALDQSDYLNGFRSSDLETRYAFMTSLNDGNVHIVGSKINNKTIEVGEGGKATIDSAGGNDTVWVWHQKSLDFDGGTGNDTLRFEYQFGFANQPSHGATIDLAAGTGTNPFGGTIKIKNVENIVGQFGAANDLRGDNHANHLEGGTEADTLMGRGGNDLIHVTYGVSLNPRETVADGGTGRDTLVAELSDSSAAPFTGSGADLRFINTLDLENPNSNTGTFHGGTFENFETIQADSSGSFYVFDFHGSDKNENILASTSEDTIDGRGGDDIIFGGYDSDQLTGGAGADRFWFRYATDSDTTNGEDTITDFKHSEHDKIDLSKIYGGKLDFIGAKNFGGHAGELHAVKQGGDTVVEVDTNGDKHADFSLLLDGGPKLVESDFVL